MKMRQGFRWGSLLSVLALLLLLAVPASAQAPNHFRAHLSQEYPDRDTLAQGQTIFRLSRDGTELHYKLIVANLHDTTMAHIHLGSPADTGPVVAWLYPAGPPAQLIPGRFSGVLAEGTITADDLVGPLAGHTMEDLLAEMRAGNTYVNVHTLTFPPGEIAGSIVAQGK
jgi:hypothetical protein